MYIKVLTHNLKRVEINEYDCCACYIYFTQDNSIWPSNFCICFFFFTIPTVIILAHVEFCRFSNERVSSRVKSRVSKVQKEVLLLFYFKTLSP